MSRPAFSQGIAQWFAANGDSISTTISGSGRVIEPGLLRNCSLEDLAGRKIDEAESQMPDALAESMQDVRPVLCVVRLGARVGIDEPFFQGPIDENRELTGGGRDRLGLADAER